AFDRPTQREHLAVVTALVRAVDVQWSAVLLFVLGDGQIGSNQFNCDAVTLADPFAQLQSLRELVASFQVNDANARLALREHVQDAAAFRTEGRGHHQLRVEPADGPGEYLLRSLATQFAARGGDLFVRRVQRIHRPRQLRPVESNVIGILRYAGKRKQRKRR